jgi:hypothetical protein
MERFKSLVVVACSLHKSVQFVQSRQSLMQLTRVSSECQLCEFLVHECVVNFCNPVSFWQKLHLRLAIVYGGKFWACVLARRLMPLCLRQTFVTILKTKVFYFCERCTAPLSRIVPQHAGGCARVFAHRVCSYDQKRAAGEDWFTATLLARRK